MGEGAMVTDTITIRGNGGDEIDAYLAKPAGAGPFPAVVVIQHIFGIDEWVMEVCRRFAHHGYMALGPNLYARIGSLGSGPVEDIAARLRSKGGLNDDVVMGDVQGAVDTLRAMPEASGKVGTIGFCMGGRFAYLAACKVQGLDAAVDCWGGRVAPDMAQPGNPPGTPPIEFTAEMSAPLLGIFGNDDRSPDVAEVNRTEEKLKELGKTYEFYRWDGAGHAFFSWNGQAHRPVQAQEGWEKVWAFMAKYLEVPVAAGAGAR